MKILSCCPLWLCTSSSQLFVCALVGVNDELRFANYLESHLNSIKNRFTVIMNDSIVFSVNIVFIGSATCLLSINMRVDQVLINNDDDVPSEHLSIIWTVSLFWHTFHTKTHIQFNPSDLLLVSSDVSLSHATSVCLYMCWFEVCWLCKWELLFQWVIFVNWQLHRWCNQSNWSSSFHLANLGCVWKQCIIFLQVFFLYLPQCPDNYIT